MAFVSTFVGLGSLETGAGGTTMLCGIEFALALTPNGFGILIGAGELLAREVWLGAI